MTSSKVFVGNLAFKTTDQQLMEAFQDIGQVKNGVVITRGRRSLGYGFVEFESPESATQAVQAKNGSTFNDRQIKVELATDNPVRPERAPPAGRNIAPAGLTATAPRPEGAGGGVARRRRVRRRERRSAPGGGWENYTTPEQAKAASVTGGAATKGDNTQPPRRRRRRPNPGNNNKSKSNEDNRVLSTTSVFVANLPFEVNDDELKGYFNEYNPKAAHVVVTRNGRSRGYGFVEFTTEKDQKTAIEIKNGKDFTKDAVTRPITVTPSYKTQEITTAEK